MRRLLQSLLLVGIVILLVTSYASASSHKNIVEILVEDGRFTTLLATIEITESEQAFSSDNWTFFAPTDDAFAMLGLNADNIGTHLSLGNVADLMLYQMMTEAYNIDELKKMQGDTTMANDWPAGLKWFDDTIWVNDDSKVVEQDIMASNGVIHVVDRVITPPWPRDDTAVGGSLTAALNEALLKEAEAEAEAAETEATEEPAEETATEEAVDETGTEATTESTTGAEGAEDTTEVDETMEAVKVPVPANSLLGVMAADGRFTTYLAAVEGLGLIQPFIEGEWTLFAPTDAAFAQQDLNADNISEEVGVTELTNLLLYHGLDGEFSSAELKTMLGDITTRTGQLAGLKYYEDDLWVNDNAMVITANILADNGTIHAVNAVIQPPWPRVETPVEFTTIKSGDTPE